MKALFIVPRFLFPLDRGDKIRPFYIAKQLRKLIANIDIITFWENSSEIKDEGLKTVRGLFRNLYLIDKTGNIVNFLKNAFFDVGQLRPIQLAGFYSDEFREKLNFIARVNDYDIIYCYHFRMAQYLSRGIFKNSYKILDYADSVPLIMKRYFKYSELYERIPLLYEIITSKFYEYNVSKYFDEYWFVSPIDKENVYTNDRLKKYVIPNGIGEEFIREKKDDYRCSEFRVLFVGYIGKESLEAIKVFYHRVWSKFKIKFSNVKFIIVGKQDKTHLNKIFGSDKTVLVKGYVENLSKEYSSACVLVAPMIFVAGVQNKILEAMAVGLPVITTPYGNEGIFAIHDKHILIANNWDEFSVYLENLYKNVELRRKIGSNGRKFIIKKFSWEEAYRRFEKILSNLTKNSNH